MVHPEVEWHTMAGPILGIEAVSGRDQVIRFVFEQIPEGIENFRVTLQPWQSACLARSEGRTHDPG